MRAFWQSTFNNINEESYNLPIQVLETFYQVRGWILSYMLCNACNTFRDDSPKIIPFLFISAKILQSLRIGPVRRVVNRQMDLQKWGPLRSIFLQLLFWVVERHRKPLWLKWEKAKHHRLLFEQFFLYFPSILRSLVSILRNGRSMHLVPSVRALPHYVTIMWQSILFHNQQLIPSFAITLEEMHLFKSRASELNIRV